MKEFLVAISGWSGDSAVVVGGVVLGMAILLAVLSVALIAAVLMQSSKDHNLSGAIAGGVSGAINGIATKGVGQLIMKEVADTLCDSVIGGGEFFINSLIAGCSFEDACKNFGYGVIAGAVISGGIKVGSAAIKGGAKLIKKAAASTISDVGGKQLTKLGNEAVEDGLSELQEKTIQKSAQKGAKEVVESTASSSDAYLKKALSQNNLIEVPTENFKTSWVDGNYQMEVRIHKGNSQFTSADQIYRVSRVPVGVSKNQAKKLMEYLGTDGNWYRISQLVIDDTAAQLTHIPIK